MSLYLANSHLRVPRGFATILEGLAREILRDQPEDIPKYAALYFHKLLKKRQGNLLSMLFNMIAWWRAAHEFLLLFLQRVAWTQLSGLPD